MQKLLKNIIVAILLLFSLSINSYCQNQSIRVMERNRLKNVHFNFNMPSARAMGMGGAFIAIADDATAGEANPAGLTNLLAPETSIHFRYNKFTHQEITGKGSDPENSKKFNNNIISQSYLSLVIPGNHLTINAITPISNIFDRIVFSIYRQELVNFKRSFFYEPFELNQAESVNGVIFNSEVLVTNWSLAVGIRLPLNVSFGFSCKYSILDSKFFEEIYSDDFALPGEKGNLPGNLALMTQANHMDRNVLPGFGFRWSQRFRQIPILSAITISSGIVYKPGPDFKIVYNLFTPLREEQDGRLRNAFAFQTEGRFKIPDSYGAGFCFSFEYKRKARVTETIQLAFDIVHILYSQLLKGISDPLKQSKFKIKDGNEYHAGVQILTSRLIPKMDLLFRSGFYTDPAHQIYSCSPTDRVLTIQFPVGEKQNHYTIGLGIADRKNFSCDIAYNHSNNIREVLFSTVLYLGKRK